MVFSRLLIPGANAPRALRRVLSTLIGRKRPDWAQPRVEATVREAERQLLEVNHRYYDDLADAVASARQRSEEDDPPGRKATLRMIDELVRRQKRHLYAYKDRLEGA
jgi:acyl-CoA reductase-like NAD-dependent aldehyde dehydrogenase